MRGKIGVSEGLLRGIGDIWERQAGRTVLCQIEGCEDTKFTEEERVDGGGGRGEREKIIQDYTT